MTKEEFMVGWDLLTTQPWGQRYAKVNDKASAITAATQLQFYFNKLNQFSSELWTAECELYAAGDHWPSVDELKQSCYNVFPKLRRIEYQADCEEAPEPIALIMAHAEAHSTTFLDALQAVLPKWCKENPMHQDHDRAAALYRQFSLVKPQGNINTVSVLR